MDMPILELDTASFIFQLIIFALTLPINLFITSRIKKIKSISNIALIKVRKLTNLSLFVVIISIASSVFKESIFPIFLPLAAYIINSIEKTGIEKFDIIMIVISATIWLGSVIIGINIFYPFLAIYTIIYVVIYIYSREYSENVKIIIFISAFILSGILLGEIGLLFNFNLFSKVGSIFVMLSVLFIQLYSILTYAIETDTVNDKMTISLIETNRTLSNLKKNFQDLVNNFEQILNFLSDESGKFSSIQFESAIKTILWSISNIEATISIVQNSFSNQSEKIEETAKKIPIGIDNFENSITNLINEKQLLSEANTNIMNLTKIALDSEKSVMEVAKAVKDLKNSVKSFVDKLSLFESISQQSEILSINISVEASKLGKESSSFSKLSKQAKKFSEIISSQISDIKNVIERVDKSSEYSEYLVKTLVMSFVEIESGLKNVSKDISSFLATVQQIYTSSSDLMKTLAEINSISMYLPSLMEEMKKRFKDMEWDYKKIRVNIEEFSKNYNILNLSLENVKNSIKNLYQLLQEAKKLL